MSSTGPDSVAPPALLSEALVIGLGGAIGSALRGALQLLWPAAATPTGPTSFPLVEPIGLANLIGAAALGAALGRLAGGRAHPLLRPFLCVGVLGSFTTWSALIAQTTRTASGGRELAALLFLGGHLALGLAAFVAGERAASRARPAPDAGAAP